MGDNLESVVADIRALLVSSKFPVPLRNLSRDYFTTMGSQIPFRRFNFQTLESFIQSVPTLRLSNSGGDVCVEAARSNASSHISQLVAKQKTAKKSGPPPRRGRGTSSYRGAYGRTYPPRYTAAQPSTSSSCLNNIASRSEPYPKRNLLNNADFIPPRSQTYPKKELSNNSNNSDFIPPRSQAYPKKELSNNADFVPPRSQTYPKKELSNNADFENLVVRVEDDDKGRQVLVRNSPTNASTKEQKKSGFEVPPRFQRKYSNTTAPSSMQTSSSSNATQDVEDTLFLDGQVHPDLALQEIDNNIISALKPSQLIAVGRAKEQVEQFDNLYFQGANSNHIQDTGPPLQERPVLVPSVPIPDETHVYNNTDLLVQYAKSMNWIEPNFQTFPRRPKGGKTVFGASVEIKNGQKYSSYPMEHDSAIVAKGYAAKRALESLLEEEKVKPPQTTICNDKNIIKDRISKIVAGFYHGMFAKTVENKYIEDYKEQLPIDWEKILIDCPTLSVEPSVKDMIITPKPALDMEEPIITSVPLLLVPPEEEIWDVFVTLATSTNDVWLRLIGENYSEKYEELLNDMANLYITNGLGHLALSIEEGQYYAAHSGEDWIRVCVTKVNDDTKTVDAYLIDNGEYDTFPFKNLYKLPIEFCTLPRQAIQASLEGLETFSEDAACCERIASCEYLIGQILIAKINSRDEQTGVVKVTLYDTSGADDVNINEKLELEFLNPVLPEEGRLTPVTVSHISKKGEIFVQIPNDRFYQLTEHIESLTPEEINRNKLTSYRQVKMNKMYLALYTKDGNWYRAIVTTPPSVQHNKISLLFVDYGNTETVTITELAELDNLPSIISKLPHQAIKVALHNVPVEDLSNYQIAKLHLKLLADERVVFMKLINTKEAVPVVEMFYKEDGDIMVTVNLTITMDKGAHGSDASTSNDKSQLTNGNVASCISLSRPQFEENDYQPVKVVLAANPGNFFFQLRKYEQELESLMVHLQYFCEIMPPPELKKSDIVNGWLYIGLHTDGFWYRMVVTGSVIDSHVPVQFCDYGDIECIPISNLRKIETEFCVLPFMAIKGKLAGIVPIHTDWSVEDCVRFQELVFNKHLASFIISAEENNEYPMDLVVSLNLVDTTSDEDIYIGNILCQENRAVSITKT